MNRNSSNSKQCSNWSDWCQVNSLHSNIEPWASSSTYTTFSSTRTSTPAIYCTAVFTHLLGYKWLEEAVHEFQQAERQVAVHWRHNLLHVLSQEFNSRLEGEIKTYVSMAQCKTVVSPLLTPWRYGSSALSLRNVEFYSMATMIIARWVSARKT